MRVRPVPACVLAFDGERERTLKPEQEATLTITREGPRVVDVAAALHYAAERGAFKLNLHETERWLQKYTSSKSA